MSSGCRGQHLDCDVCDGIRRDPDTGWGGFTDHFAGKHFNTTEEQAAHYRDAKRNGGSGEREDGPINKSEEA